MMIKQIPYFSNIESLQVAVKQDKITKNTDRIYFGQEFCEHLAPELREIKQVIDILAEHKTKITFVTGSIPERKIEETESILELLDSEKKEIEIVCNDWGSIDLINNKFQTLKPILGRLLTKNRRMAHFSVLPDPKIKFDYQDKEEIIKNQKKVLSENNLTNANYLNFLGKLGIERVELDYVRTGISPELINNLTKENIKISFYSPFAYVTGGRLCRTAGLFDKTWMKYVTDKKCQRYCIKNKVIFKPEHDEKVFIEGNSIFVDVREESDEFISNMASEGIDRVIVQGSSMLGF